MKKSEAKARVLEHTIKYLSPAKVALFHAMGIDPVIGRREGYRIWEDGEPVSFTGFGGPTASGIRIGPVYTPQHLRRRGYATALVAEVSRDLLARGHRFCFLYTDLANPTSNAIYQGIGYRLVCTSAMVSLRYD